MSIIKASERGGATYLGRHLMNMKDNDHVEVHEIRGFVSDNVVGALKEIYAVSLGTRCKNFMFSVSFNPPETENVAVSVFEDAINRVEKSNGLDGQPRVIVFHEKEGRRHAHCVWSRIDVDTMTAVNLPYYKNKSMDISRQMYIENGWEMPDGLKNKSLRDPLNFTLGEWQQAKREGFNLREVKSIFQYCWQMSDSRKAFAFALSEHGFTLAKGYKEFVAVDYKGRVHAVSRRVSLPDKDIKARLGSFDGLPSVEQAKYDLSQKMNHKLKSFISDKEKELDASQNALDTERHILTQNHRNERQRLKEHHEKRRIEETMQWAARFRKGILGAWDLLSGRNAKIKAKNKLESYWCEQRDNREKQSLIEQQLSKRQELQKQILYLRQQHLEATQQINKDIAHYLGIGQEVQKKAGLSRQDTLQTDIPIRLKKTFSEISREILPKAMEESSKASKINQQNAEKDTIEDKNNLAFEQKTDLYRNESLRSAGKNHFAIERFQNSLKELYETQGQQFKDRKKELRPMAKILKQTASKLIRVRQKR